MGKKKTGAREWAKQTVNIQRGCENNCRYCYARTEAIRFRRCSADEWSTPVIDYAKVSKQYRRRQGVTMFPSTHDITARNIDECMTVLYKLLSADNKVLIVTKPAWDCVLRLCGGELDLFKDQMTFRFTIGSMNEEVLAFWEPGAPTFLERLQCLTHATQRGFKTSVSAEPYLDGEVVKLFMALTPLVTECIWVGTLRHFSRRVNVMGMTAGEIVNFVQPVIAAQTDEAVCEVYRQLKGEPLVRWKDSIQEILGRTGAS